MIIPMLQIGPLGAGLQKKIASILTMPRVGEIIAKFHQISVPDAMARSDLVLDTPNFCSTLDSGSGAKASMVSNGYVMRKSPSSDTM